MDRCAQCDFTYEDLARGQIAEALRTVARQYPSRLHGGGPSLAPARRARDLLQVQWAQVRLVLRHDVPALAPAPAPGTDPTSDRDAAGAGALADDLVVQADALAGLLDVLREPEWRRSGIDADGRARDVAWLGRHAVHGLLHELFATADAVQGQPGTPDGIGSG